MARGNSGRIVIEVNPDFKRQHYSVLTIDNQILKDLFVESAHLYLSNQKNQPG